jgi:hypothetical protein
VPVLLPLAHLDHFCENLACDLATCGESASENDAKRQRRPAEIPDRSGYDAGETHPNIPNESIESVSGTALAAGFFGSARNRGSEVCVSASD